MGNTCKAAPVERETQLPSGAPAGGGEELAEMLQAKENQWRELERGYKQQMRQLEEQNRGFQDDIRNLQTLTEELLASKEGGGPDGEHGEFRGGPHDEGALAETMEEVERLRELVAEFERGSAEVVGFREKVEALERRNAELEERASSQQKAVPSSRELVALQAERRALAEEKIGLESTLEETRMQLTKAEEELSKQSPDDHAQAELSDLRAENMGLAQRCKALTELAEQACARAEDVAQKFEQAAALHGNGGNSDDGHPSAEDVLSKTNLVVPAYLRVEGRPVTPAPLGGSYTAAAPAAVGAFGLSVSVGGLSTMSTSGGRLLPASRILQGSPATHHSVSPGSVVSMPREPFSSALAPREPISAAMSPGAGLIGTYPAVTVAQPASPASMLPSTPPAPRPVRGTGLDLLSSSGGSYSHHSAVNSGGRTR
mmetsp:Transcript_14329/g.50290  ORF Transcript_14329/g.50290 Transcript_14329/m.50290 type:complete len:430 (+) Transcript_14329:117-1406(+)